MKVGDKLYCKKTLIYFSKKFFIKNNFYTINKIGSYRIIICDEMMTANGSEFKLYTPNEDEYKFNDYFYTEQEYRKLKIEKLNKI